MKSLVKELFIGVLLLMVVVFTLGILITIVAIFMVLVPQFFMRLKSPRIPDKLLKNPKMKIVLRAWGSIFVIVGILLIVFSII